MFPHLIWDFQSYLGRKTCTSETFLSLGLFISWPRPTTSASKMWPRLRKTFPRFPFVYFDNLGKTQIRGPKFFFRRVIEKKTEQYYFVPIFVLTTSEDKFVHVWFEIWPKLPRLKKGNRGKVFWSRGRIFEAKAVGRGREMNRPRLRNVSKVPFFLPR